MFHVRRWLLRLSMYMYILSSVLCQEKRVKQAYYQLCRECAVGRGVCAKCEKDEVVER